MPKREDMSEMQSFYFVKNAVQVLFPLSVFDLIAVLFLCIFHVSISQGVVVDWGPL